jgi:hypothetical protein
MKDLDYRDIKELWAVDKRFYILPFLLDAWIGHDGKAEYGLLQDHETTRKVMNVLHEHGYTCSIVERLLENGND